MEKLKSLADYMTAVLVAGNLWAVSRLWMQGHVFYLSLGVTNILIIG